MTGNFNFKSDATDGNPTLKSLQLNLSNLKKPTTYMMSRKQEIQKQNDSLLLSKRANLENQLRKLAFSLDDTNNLGKFNSTENE